MQGQKGKLSQPTKILLGLLLGALSGLLLNVLFAAEGGPTYERIVWFADNVANPAGQVFLRMLFMVVVPLVFTSISLGVASVGDLRDLGRVGRRTFTWFIGTTALAVCLGLLMVNTFEPGKTLSAEDSQRILASFQQDATKKIAQAQQGPGFSVQTFVEIIPKNAFAAAADDRQTLGLIFFAIMVGIAITLLPSERMEPLMKLLQAIYDVSVTVLGFAMKIAPIGVFGLIFGVTVKLGLQVLLSLGYYVLVALAGLAIHQFVVLGGLGALFVGINPLVLFSKLKVVLITAFSTSSSNATLPTTIRTTIDEFQVKEGIAGFVLPLGATMNMNGTALFEGVSVLFLAQVAGIDLSLADQFIVVVMAVLTAIGAAGVPGGSLPLLTLVLVRVGVPPEMLALILGVDRLVDMARTVPNVTSDILCALWVDKAERAR